MTTKALAPAAGVVLALVLFLSWNSYRIQRAELLAPIVCESEATAIARGTRYIADHGGSLLPVAGTGSMAPVIPPAPAGSEPRTTVVAWAATDPRATFSNVTRGSLDLYLPTWSANCVLHQAAAKSGDGWIMSGLNTAHYERGDWRMTAQNFKGIAVAVFVWPLEGSK